MPGMIEQQRGELECGEEMSDDTFCRDYNFCWVEIRPEGRKGKNIMEGSTRSKLSNEVVRFWIF